MENKNVNKRPKDWALTTFEEYNETAPKILKDYNKSRRKSETKDVPKTH